MHLKGTGYYNRGSSARRRYVDSICGNLPILSRVVKEELEESDFLVATAIVSLERTNRGIRAKVNIERDPRVAYTPYARSILEGGAFGGRVPDYSILSDFRLGKREKVNEVPMRMSAGGAITILDVPENGVRKEYIVIGQKGTGAVIHSGHLVPSSGLSERQEEWTDPLIIICDECVEEVRLLDKAGCVAFLPVFSFDDAGETKRIQDTVSKTFQERIEMGQHYNREPVREEPCKCPATVEPLGMDELEINWEGHESRTLEGLLVLDPVFGALDLMAAVRIELPLPLSKIQVLDGEGITKRNILFNDPKFVFEPEELVRLFNGEESIAFLFHSEKRSGECIHERKVRLSSAPFINPPLWDAGPALLGSRYHYEIRAFRLSEAGPLRLEEV